ncbi:enoyl-CoA hydratase/isomerase family protein [Pseudomonas typographi]|uniref:enoyl-CoA hydratase/isomerase family protein n=1 Tax=Pseudomonas typographi TaxID=2715964 RepID=UPI0016832E76|nr:enoyl-CoA hydratase/isomerase family protein [Pseudomonas typographi]MBD1586980.1 enoyl-CoA hydratase/isomerase family protein [Pseudomonas typographi]
MTAAATTSDSALQPAVKAHVDNGLGWLTLNRPGGLNTLTLEMLRQLQAALDAWAQDAEVQAVVLRGAGDKAFCAGGDVRALYHSYHHRLALHEAFFSEEYALGLALHHYRKPVLAIIDGYCLGGGMGLAQAAALRVVTQYSQLAMPATAVGFFPDVGGSYFLSHVPGELGTYLGITGERIDAANALYCGLADWYLARERLATLEARLLRIQWSAAPLKDLQNVLAKLGVQVLPEPSLAPLRTAIDHFFGQADVPAMMEQLRQVEVGGSRAWALRTAATMAQRSPLAMAVTHQLLLRGRRLPLEACFAQETHVGKQWLAHGEFLEGIRALLVDKDNQPRWAPRTLAGLDPAIVHSFFERL